MKHVYSVHFSWKHSSDDNYQPDGGIFFSTLQKAMSYYRAVTGDLASPDHEGTGIIAENVGNQPGIEFHYYSVRRSVLH